MGNPFEMAGSASKRHNFAIPPDRKQQAARGEPVAHQHGADLPVDRGTDEPAHGEAARALVEEIFGTHALMLMPKTRHQRRRFFQRCLQVLDACDPIAPEQIDLSLGASHSSVLRTFRHIHDGERVWLQRLVEGGSKHFPAVRLPNTRSNS